MTVWLLCAAVAPAEDPEDERPPNPEMQREELVNLEKENARAIKFEESNIFQVRVLRRFSPCFALRRSRKRSRIDSVRIRFLGQLRPSSKDVSRRRLCTEHAFL